MNWDDLKIILAIFRKGTMSGAAEQLGIQHSTVSRRIKALEKQLGTTLVRRHKTVYKLTQAGLKIKELAVKVEKDITSLDGTLFNKEDPLIGTLRVTTISSLASSALMPMFAEFSHSHPEIDFHVMVSSSTASLTNREADIAIRLSNEPPDILIGKRVVTVASTLYASKNHIKKSQKNLNWIGVTCCGFHKSWTKDACGNHHYQFNSDDAMTTLAAIKQGVGISYLPCYIGDPDPEIERYTSPQEKHNLGLWVLIHPELKHNARVIAFRDYIIKAIENKRDLFLGNNLPTTKK